jgi:hypothetical protein
LRLRQKVKVESFVAAYDGKIGELVQEMRDEKGELLTEMRMKMGVFDMKARRLWQSLSHHFRVAHECLIEFLRTSLGLPEGVLGIVMAIHTFGVPARAPLRVVFQQDAPPAGQACGRRITDRGVTP